jgi:hypothetical protein
VNHKKVCRLMRAHDLQPRVRRRYVTTTDSDHDSPIFPNLARDIVPNWPDQLWVADLTYVAVTGGFVYVAIILDAWSRRVVGYALGRSIDARLTIAPLPAAGAVGDLDRLRQSADDRFTISAATVAGDDLDRGVLLQPGLCSGLLAVR